MDRKPNTNNQHEAPGAGAKERARLLTRTEVAEIFGLSKRWLEVAACQGEGPPIVRITPRMVRYRFADIEAWIEAHTDYGTAKR